MVWLLSGFVDFAGNPIPESPPPAPARPQRINENLTRETPPQPRPLQDFTRLVNDLIVDHQNGQRFWKEELGAQKRVATAATEELEAAKQQCTRAEEQYVKVVQELELLREQYAQTQRGIKIMPWGLLVLQEGEDYQEKLIKFLEYLPPPPQSLDAHQVVFRAVMTFQNIKPVFTLISLGEYIRYDCKRRGVRK